MKKTFIYIALFLLTGVTAYAQAPQSFNYQGVARNAAGVPMASTTLGLRLTVHDGSATGTTVYQESQTPTTNSFGLYNVTIGGGTIISGTFNNINWGSGGKYLEVEIDPAGGVSYVAAGTSQLLSVPYAVYANNATTATSAGSLTGTVAMGGDVTGTNAAASVVKLNGNAVSATAPASGQVLTWNSGTSTWGPATPASWGSMTSLTAGSGLSGGTITTSGTISMPGVGTAGTYGSATQVPVITTDAQGRVSGVTNTTITGDDWGTQVAHTDATLAGNGTVATPLKIAQQSATTGQALEWNGTSWLPATIPAPVTYTAGTGLTLTGTTFSAQSTTPMWNANQLQGNIISITAPTTGQGLVWSGSLWTPTTLAPTYTAGTGITISGGAVNAQTTTALWNADELQGKNISGTAPTTGQVLEWNGTAWAPTTPSGSGTVTSVTAGTGLSGGTITTSGTISLPNVGTASTYGSATQVPVITTDAQGRVTGVTNTTISSSSGTVTSINTAAPLYGGPITSSGTIGMTTSGVTAASYGTATQVPTITVDSWGRITAASNTTISGVSPAGTATGDLTGSYPAPSLITTGVTAGTYGSTTTSPVVIVDTKGRITSASNATIALTMGGDVTGSNSSTSVVKIQGKSVSSTAPTSGQELTWNSGTSAWTPTNPSGGTVTSVIAGTGLSGGTITGAGTISMPNVGTAATYGSATQTPVLTTDAQGRITGVTNTTITTGVAGTTNYIPVFTSATAIGNSIMYQNPASGNRIGINYGATNHGLVALKSTGDTIGLYMNLNSTPGYGGYGFERIEYTGPNDQFRVGILSTMIKSVSDASGTGLEGAGNTTGVYGIQEASSTTAGKAYGVEGDSYYDGSYSVGVGGFGSNWTSAPTHCYGVYGYQYGGVAATSYAIYSDGNMHVNGAISKSSGTFKIDHPLDPANKYLSHSFVESPDMMNIYNGNITTDATGTAIVTMPDYFDALNKDFRYQVTVIGTFAQAIISEKISDNKFTIKTSLPNVEVSWQVTGVRQDAWANAHRVVPEEDKAAEDKGKYMHPELFGQPANMQIGTPEHKSRKNDPALISHDKNAGEQK